MRIAERLHIGDELPALPLRQGAPRRHSLVGRSVGDEPEDRAIRRRLRRSFRDGRHGSVPLPMTAMARAAVGCVQPRACSGGRLLPRIGILRMRAGRRCAIKRRVLRRQPHYRTYQKTGTDHCCEKKEKAIQRQSEPPAIDAPFPTRIK